MIEVNEHNRLVFSKLLRSSTKYKSDYKNLIDVLNYHNISWELIENTKDIWARDYMPCQISKDHFVQFKYEPDYLKPKKYEGTRTDVNSVLHATKDYWQESDLILDGGNLIYNKDTLFITDKVIVENSTTTDKLVEALKSDFNLLKVVLIPWDKEDYLGHSDSMLRILDNDTVLVNHYFKYYPKSYRDRFYGIIEDSGFNIIELSLPDKFNHKADWCYLNFLQIEDFMIIPQIGIKADSYMYDQVKEVYSGLLSFDKINKCSIPNIVKEGGAMNCISWTFRS